MNYRKLSGYQELSDDLLQSFDLLHSFKDSIRDIQDDYDLEEDKVQRLKDFEKKIDDFYQQFGTSSSDLCMTISNEIINTTNHVSEKYQAASKKLEEIFEGEDEIYQEVVSGIWKNETDNYFKIVHSGNHFIVLSNYHSTTISCSLLSPKHMDMYHSHLGIEFEYTPESFLCSCFEDMATYNVSSPSVLTVGKKGEMYTKAGHHSRGALATKLFTPKMIERSCLNRAKEFYQGMLGITNDGKSTSSSIINEIILDAEKAKPKSIYLETTGTEFLLSDYYDAWKMAKQYQLPIRVENIAACRRRNGLVSYSEEEQKRFIQETNRFMNGGYKEVANVLKKMSREELKDYLEGYKRDILGNLDENVAYVHKKALTRVENELNREKAAQKEV